jgi:tetratricopeptide (TPR) repeat protein
MDAAGTLSHSVLGRAPDARTLDQLLDIWANDAPAGAVFPNAEQLAAASSGDARVSFAHYFNSIRKPDLARKLLGAPQTPVAPGNARWNAVYAQALDASDQTAQAFALYNMVLQVETDQVDALAGRTMLFARTGHGREAIADAERLVSAEPNSGSDRLILANAFNAAGKRDEMRRTLWDAFQTLPDDDSVFAALRQQLLASGDVDGARRLNDERVDRRFQALQHELA